MGPLFSLASWRRAKKKPGMITALLAMADPVARRAMKQAILRRKPATIVEVDNKKAFHNAVTFQEIDLIVADAELNGCLSFDIIEQIRFGRLHCHAFPIVMMMVEHSRAHCYQRVVDCGADMVLIGPDAANHIPDHIARLTLARKPFVVAPHYIGPERRAVPREGESSAEWLAVPNPLSARIDAVAEQDYRRAISVATHSISLMRRCLYTVRTLNSMPVSSLNDNNGLVN